MIYTCKPTKVAIYINTGRKTAAQIKAETGCTALINGGLFDGAFRPVCHLKVSGVQLAKDQYKYWGYAIDSSGKMRLVEDYTAYPHFISCVCMVRNGKPETMYYNTDMGGARQRTAIGLFADGRIWLYCDKTGKTPEQLRQIALDAGVDSALMLDGGGSTQGIFPGGTVTSSRIVHNFICVWEAEPKKEDPKPMKICIDPGHGGTENYNASPDKTYYEHEFTLGTAQRLQKLLAPHMDITMTRTADQTVSLSNRASIANMAKVNAFISIHSNATSGSGWQSPRGLCVYIYAAGGEREKLARALIAAFKAAGIILHGNQIYYNPALTVLAQTTMPAVLIEYGFHTNQDDVALLKTSAYRDKLAAATAKGICDYFGISFKAPDEATPGTDIGGVIDQLIASGISLKELLLAIANKL
jgi:N-acetylmuramoyl-L-alanine amidase